MDESNQLAVINISDILPNRFQPRIKFDEPKLYELADSIRKYGVIQPIVVRPVNGRYEIIAGERRFKASKIADKTTIPAIIVNLTDKVAEEIALLENVQRQQLSPIEEAVSYKRILDMGYITKEELSNKIGKSQSAITKKIRLLNLDDQVQEYLLNNKISERHARSLLRIDDKEKQVEMLHRIVNERLTVKKTDREISKLLEELPEKNSSVLNNSVNNQSNDIESLFDDFDSKKENSIEERGQAFMDIDKIMREAKDINQTEPPKDISQLMKQDTTVQPISTEQNDINVVLPTETPVEPTTEQSRFFNLNMQRPEPTPVKSEPINNSVTFDSIFNQSVSPTTSNNIQNNVQDNSFPISDSSRETSEIGNNPVSVTEQSKFFNSNMQQSEPTPVKSEEPITTPIISDEAKQTISSAIADAFKNNQVEVSKPSNPVTNNSSFEEELDNFSNVPNADIYSSKTDTPIVEPIPVVSEPINNTSLDNNSNSIPFTPIQPISNLSEVNYSEPSTISSGIVQPVKAVNSQANFSQVVKILRDCANQIEQLGYYINVDEMDLGNQYKTTFTINKD